MDKKLFISHATADANIVEPFVRFLKDGLGINGDDIFCTSMIGTLKTGDDFIAQIKESLQGCKKVVFIITENYLRSAFCLAELGAAWAIEQNIYPIIVPPVTFSDLSKTPLSTVQAQDISSDCFTSILRDEMLKEGIACGSITTTQFTSAVSEFNHSFSSTLNKAPQPLVADAQGYAIATVVEYRKLAQNKRVSYHGYKLKEKIVHVGINEKNTSHWLLHLAKNGLFLTANDKVKFRPNEITEDTDGLNGDRLFFATDLWAVDIKL